MQNETNCTYRYPNCIVPWDSDVPVYDIYDWRTPLILASLTLPFLLYNVFVYYERKKLHQSIEDFQKKEKRDDFLEKIDFHASRDKDKEGIDPTGQFLIMVGISLSFKLAWQFSTLILNLVMKRDPYFGYVNVTYSDDQWMKFTKYADYCSQCPKVPELHMVRTGLEILNLFSNIFYACSFFFLGQYFFVLAKKFRIKRDFERDQRYVIASEHAHEKYSAGGGSSARREAASKLNCCCCSCSPPNVGCCWSSTDNQPDTSMTYAFCFTVTLAAAYLVVYFFLVGEKVGTSDTGIVSSATEVLAKVIFITFPIAKNSAYLYVVVGCFELTRLVVDELWERGDGGADMCYLLFGCMDETDGLSKAANLVSKLAIWAILIFLGSNLRFIDVLNQYMGASDVAGSEMAMTVSEMWALSFNIWHVPCSTCPWFTLLPDILISFMMVHMMNPKMPTLTRMAAIVANSYKKKKDDSIKCCRSCCPCCDGEELGFDEEEEAMVELHWGEERRRPQPPTSSFGSSSSSSVSSSLVESSTGLEKGTESEWF